MTQSLLLLCIAVLTAYLVYFLLQIVTKYIIFIGKAITKEPYTLDIKREIICSSIILGCLLWDLFVFFYLL